MKKFPALFLFLLFFSGVTAGCAPQPGLPDDYRGGYVDAQELKLRVGELADQLLTTMPSGELRYWTALPVSFVNQQNMQETSALGRYFAEGLIYEFNQRGLPVREYRLDGNITSDSTRGDFALARQVSLATRGKPMTTLLIGTYLRDKDATFINARLVRASDGMILRTGELVLMNTPIIDRLSSQRTTVSRQPPLPAVKGRVVLPRPVPGHSAASGAGTGMNTVSGGSGYGAQPVRGTPVSPRRAYPLTPRDGAHSPACALATPDLPETIDPASICTGTLEIKKLTPSTR